MNTRKVYPIPKPTKKYVDSVYIERWCAKADNNTEGQTTIYREKMKELVAAGLAPAQIFNDIGRSEKKQLGLLPPKTKNSPFPSSA